MMDTSEKYIKMCEKAGEIQDFKKLPCDSGVDIERESFYVSKEDGQYWRLCPESYVFNTTVQGYVSAKPRFGCKVQKREIIWKANEVIWLPRQDQLQEMLSRANTYHLSETFFNWFHNKIVDKDFFKFVFVEPTASLEQIWFMYVMEEKHGKIWDNSKEEWVKDG